MPGEFKRMTGGALIILICSYPHHLRCTRKNRGSTVSHKQTKLISLHGFSCKIRIRGSFCLFKSECEANKDGPHAYSVPSTPNSLYKPKNVTQSFINRGRFLIHSLIIPRLNFSLALGEELHTFMFNKSLIVEFPVLKFVSNKTYGLL